MVKTREELNQKAEKEILEIIADDGKWNLFVEIMNLKRGNFIKPFMRERAKEPGPDRAILVFYYQWDILQHTCDICDYNPRQRRGIRRFFKKIRFDCTWRKTKGDVLAEQTGNEEGFPGASYKFNDHEWKAKYQELSKTVLEEHTDRTKPPRWLDEKRNYCLHYYIDLTKP